MITHQNKVTKNIAKIKQTLYKIREEKAYNETIR